MKIIRKPECAAGGEGEFIGKVDLTMALNYPGDGSHWDGTRYVGPAVPYLRGMPAVTGAATLAKARGEGAI